MPDQDAPQPGSHLALLERLRRRIETNGPITFAEFMDLALYDPAEGFYSGVPVGEAGDFVTAPHVSPVFGMLVARQVEEFWELLGRPDPFDVIEAGAGDGTLARQILDAAPADLALRYTAVERSAAGRAVLADLPIEVAADLRDLQPVPDGCVIANELLDNLPFHRVRQTEHGLVELFVTTDGSRFALVEGPLSSPEVERASPRIRSAQEAVVNLGALRFVDDAASRLERGYVWLVDYGPEPGQPVSGVHGYRGHRAEGDILSAPGSRDITAGVDFAALAGHARDRGLHVWGPVAQREALLNLGFRDLDRRAQERQVEAVAARRGIDAMRIYSNRTRANLLLGRAGLGAFWVLCLGVGADVPSMSVRER